VTFTAPLALLLLLALPVAAFIGWPRRRFQRARAWASLFIRLLILLLIVLALAGASLVREADQLAVVFVLDHSDSVDEAARAAQAAFVADALAALPPGDEAAVVVFGANALVERPMSPSAELGPLRSTPITGNTDLEEALSLGMALFPEGAARRIVVLSDGAQTVGDAAAAARRAAANDVQIDVVPLARAPGPELQVTAVDAPEQVARGQQFDVNVTIDSDQDTRALLTLTAGGQLLYREAVQLRAGANNVPIQNLTATEVGFRDFQVRIEPEGADTYYQNNALGAFSRVTGPPQVLVVRRDADETRSLVAALTTLGYGVIEREPAGLPARPAGLVEFDSVVLANVPATALSNNRMESLGAYVRDLGGGLVVIGGPESYGPGGYFQTPLEDALPVESQIRDQQRLPQLTIVYVIDRSGSMATVGPSGVENIDLAKEAIVRSIDFLQPTDRAGVVSFDTDGAWIADVQPVLNRLSLQTQVAQLSAGGGTDILAGLRLAGDALREDPSPRKHIILLTDGGAPETGLTGLARTLNQEAGITTSVIAIGRAAGAFLDDMAKAGGGNYHAVELVESIPAIFTQEAVLATRAYLIEGAFTPSAFQSTPILDDLDALPPLLGYVATTPRQTAQVGLRADAPYFDPILAQWQYGLGRVVAFTSDARDRWGAEWVGWDEFPRFWGQAVGWSVTESAASNIEALVTMQGERAALSVDARADDGRFLNGLLLRANVLPPDGEAFEIPVRQTAPGRYEADFTPGREGAYLVRLYGEDGTGAAVNETTGWVMTYSPEYSLTRRVGGDALAEIAALTNGRDLTGQPAEAFAHTLQAQPAFNPISFELLLLALLLVPLDVAVRRLLITRSDLARARAALRRQPAAPAASAQMQSLKDAKARTRQTLDDAQIAPPAMPASPAPAPPRDPAPEPAAPPADGGNLAGELLKRRKPREE
jgi:Mg-chelatase subunit ChlD